MRILNVDRNWIINWFKRPEAIDQAKKENIRFISINGFSGAFEEENFEGTQKSPIPQEHIDNGQALPLNFDDATDTVNNTTAASSENYGSTNLALEEVRRLDKDNREKYNLDL